MEIQVRVDHYIHHDVHDDVSQRLVRMENKIDLLIETGEMLMAIDSATAKRLDAATNAIAERMQKLLDAAKSQQPLTPEEEAMVQADIAKLESMGKDPNNPVT